MTIKDMKELKLLLWTIQLKKAAEKRIGITLEANGMKRKGIIIHDQRD